MADQSLRAVTTDIEKELLKIIIENLTSAKMTVEQARLLTREFLSLLPLQDKKDLLEKLYKFEVKHRETKSLYLKFAVPIEEEERQKKLALMSQHIKNGHIENALAVAKGGFESA